MLALALIFCDGYTFLDRATKLRCDQEPRGKRDNSKRNGQIECESPIVIKEMQTTMNRPPRDSKEGIFAGGLFFDIAYQGILVTLLTITSYIIGSFMDPEVGSWAALRASGISEHGMTMAFLTMSMCEIFHSFNLRSQRKSVFSLKSQNKVLWAAMIGSLVLTTLLLEVPFLANAFGFMPIGLEEYGIAMGLAFLVIPIVEIVKFFQRMGAKK